LTERLALATVVTESVLEEFLILKESVDLFHPGGFSWFIRVDCVSMGRLSSISGIHCTPFTERLAERPDTSSFRFRKMAAEKMNAMDDAWRNGQFSSVVFLDADLIITHELFPALQHHSAEVILVPHHFPYRHRRLEALYGRYNAGFVYSRTPQLSTWWRDAFLANPHMFAEQGPLDLITTRFSVDLLDENANIGAWRSPSFGLFPLLSSQSLFLHVHLFQPLGSPLLWIQKMFATHCLRFLRDSNIPNHDILFNSIIARDRSGWYKATLGIS
jgi:hypothetical protein